MKVAQPELIRAENDFVNVTSAIFAMGMPWADSSTLCARRQVATDPVPLRMIGSRRLTSSSSINVRIVSTESASVVEPSSCATGSRPRPAKAGVTVDIDINSRPATTSKVRNQPWVPRSSRSSAARIWLSHSVPSRRPFGSWSPRSQRHVVIIASTRIRHSRSKS